MEGGISSFHTRELKKKDLSNEADNLEQSRVHPEQPTCVQTAKLREALFVVLLWHGLVLVMLLCIKISSLQQTDMVLKLMFERGKYCCYYKMSTPFIMRLQESGTIYLHTRPRQSAEAGE